MPINAKTATAAIALMIAAGAYPVTGIAQDDITAEIIVDQGNSVQGKTNESNANADAAIDQKADTESADRMGNDTESSAQNGKADDVTGSESDADMGENTEAPGADSDQAAGQATDIESTTMEDTDTATEATTEATTTIEQGSAESTAEGMAAADSLDADQKRELEQAASDDKPVPPQDMLIGVQQEDQWLSSELIGTKVHNPQGDTIGDIGGIIFGADGPEGVIVEVGGFLGIGKKNVAIRWNELTMTDDGIAVDATKDELTNAPEFLSLEAQGLDASLKHRESLFRGHDRNMMRDDMGTTGGALDTRPTDDDLLESEHDDMMQQESAQ